MAGRFLPKLFRSAPAPSPEIVAALGELERLAQERSELAGPIVLVRDFLLTLYQQPMLDVLLSLATDHAAAKLAGGVPLLRGERLELDVKAFRGRWLNVCELVQRHQEDNAGKLLAEASRNGTLDANLLAAELFAGGAQAIRERTDVLGLDPGLTQTVLRLTLLPVLARTNAACAPLRGTARWTQGYCPLCGCWPLLGEFRGLEQTRFLRCGLCTAEWEFPRLLCPFCGTRDHRLLGYLHVEGEEAQYRAATCDACRGYVKMVSTLAALTGPQLLVAELATLHLDFIALQQDYLPPV
jgi:FdhE protein